MAGYPMLFSDFINLWTSGLNFDKQGNKKQALDTYNVCLSMLPWLPASDIQGFKIQLHSKVAVLYGKLSNVNDIACFESQFYSC